MRTTATSSNHVSVFRLLHGTDRVARRAARCVGFVVACITLVNAAHGQLREWTLVDPELHAATTLALERYFAVVRPDSLRLHYLERNRTHLRYRLRGAAPGDASGTVVTMSLGQLTLFPESNVRVALGEDLYRALVASRTAESSGERIVAGDRFGADDWSESVHMIVALDRVDIRLSPSFGLFASMGAPESNQFFWCDGTARIGITTPTWELAALAPIAGGATSVGPLRERLLAPSWGAAGTLRAGRFIATARFTSPAALSFEAPRVGTEYIGHTITGQITLRHMIESDGGTLRFDLGGGYEEYTQLLASAEDALPAGHVRRLSPVIAGAWTNPAQTVQARLGYRDLAPSFGFGARLTEHLWLEADLACAGLFRAAKQFEHPFYLFITPRIKF